MLKQALNDELRCGACASGQLKAPVNIPDFEYAIQGSANYSECERCVSFTQTPMPEATHQFAESRPDMAYGKSYWGILAHALMATAHSDRPSVPQIWRRQSMDL